MFTIFLKRSRVLFTGVVLLFLASCGGGGNSGEVEEIAEVAPVILEDSSGILATVGVTSVEALKEKVSKSSAVSLTLELTEADSTLKAETVVRLLKQNNRNIEYQKLKTNGISEEVIVKLKELPVSPVALKNLVRLPDPKLFPMPNLSQQAIDLFNAEKLKVLNRKLRLADQAPVDSTQFQQIQTAFSKVEIEDNFGNLDQQFQNVLVKDDTSARPASGFSVKANRSAELDLFPGYYLGNYEMEQDGVVDPDLPFADSCVINRPDLPMPVAQVGSDINSNLVTSDSGNATVKLPHTGIALFAISSNDVITVNLQKSDGSSLLNQQVAGTYYLHLPVTVADVCQPFTFVGASNNYNIQLIDLKQSERFSQHFYFEGIEYLSAGNQQVLVGSSAYFNAQSYTFSTINSSLNEVDLLFNMESGSAGNTGFDVLVFSPSGKIYSATQTGITGSHSAQGFTSTINREHGVWRVDLLPPGSVQTSADKMTGIRANVASNNDSGRYLNVLAAVNTDNQVQTREFMLGVLKNVSLKTQGDDGGSNEGEISLTLNTTMAPKLNVPSYLDDMITRDGKMNDQIALWQCWENSEKTGLEFGVDQACHEYKDEFERTKDLYESIRNNQYDPQNDPIYYQCRDENGDEDVCIRGVPAPYSIQFPSEVFKVLAVMNDYSRTMAREYHDAEYLNVLSSYYDLYLSWKDRTVQTDTGSFPYDGLAYKTREITSCNEAVTGCDFIGYQLAFYSPVIIETNRPVFGVPVDRVNESTLPIHFDYIAMDQDEYDEDAELFAVLSYAATQIYNVATGNFVGIVCDSIGLVDDLHELEMDAEDDPLGSARVSINRYSRSDPFYGLHNAENFNFFMSGVPEGNTEIDTYGQNLNYAQMVCDVANLNASGLIFDANSDSLLSLDNAQFTQHADLVQAITGIAGATNSPQLASQADEIATMLENGQLEEARQLMKLSTNVSSLTQGTDVYSDLQTLLTTFAEQGSAANGNNVIKSNAHYLLGKDRKTRAEVEFMRVQSVPVASLSVTLDSVKIISNSEDDDDARVYLKPYVGLISDRDRGGLNTHSLFADEDDSSGAATGFLRFYHVADGQLLTPNARIFTSQPGHSNVAAVYVELAVTEDDGMSVEDDDMIGIFSQTFKLEEIFNANAQFKWDYLGGDQYQLVVSEYPVYGSRNQRTLENPLTDEYALQQQHNQNRSPGALVSFTISLQVGDLTDPYPQVDTSLNVAEVNTGKDTYSMNMNEINSLDIVDMDQPQLFDVLNGLAIVTPGHDGVDGAVFHYDVETFALSELFRYDIKNFSGDLLPIQQALTSTKAISGYVADGLRQNRTLPLIKLLPDNRLLFAFSSDEAAKLMVVSFSDQGVMTLESSQTILEADGSSVYSLMDATLSPDRNGLLVPYIPESYKGGDKTTAVYPKVLYYRLQGNDFVYQSTLENFSETITAVEFIRDDAVSVTAKKLAYVTTNSTVWDWLDSYTKDLHATCDSSSMNCLYEVVGRDILIVQIDDSGQMALKDTLNHYAAPIQYGSGKTVNYYTALNQQLIDKTGIKHAETLSATSTDAVLRYNKTLYQLYFDMNINGYVNNGSSFLVPRKQILYNPVGLYYCAEGLSCAGYLQSANDANGNDENTYVSSQRVMDFDFADYARDLILSISTQAVDASGDSCYPYIYVDWISSAGIVGGVSFIKNPDCNTQSQLHLTSLYDGPAAFKGPQISGDIFDTEVTMDGGNDIAGMTFTFEVSDRDTRVDQLAISVTAQNDPFDETIKAPFKINNPLYTASCETTQDGQGSCSGTLIPDYENASFKQQITVSVSDGIYTSERNFTLFLDREAPLLENASQTVQLVTPETYQVVDFTLDSSTSASSTNCGGTSYCYLIHNGFVDEWSWDNKPVWLSCSEQLSSSYGSQRLRCTGQPPMGQAGSFIMQINAWQMKGTAYQKSASMMMTIDVLAPDTQPDAFSFTTQSDTELDTLLESSTITVSGLTGYATLSLDKGEYWRSSTTAWSTNDANDIMNGETIRLRLQTSTEFSATTSASLNIGGMTGNFTLNTKADPNANDSTPDAFSFNELLDQSTGQLIESNTVTVSGIWIAAPVTVSNGEYQINNSGWTSQPGSVENGQTVIVRHTTSDQYSTLVATGLTIGGVSAEFRSTTMDLLAPSLSAAVPISEPAINTLFSFTPANSGGEIESWSITNKPAWANFDSASGTLSGTVDSFDSFSIEITASNATGSDTFSVTVNVQPDDAPYINGYAVDCSIDVNTCDFTFTENARWRGSVTQVTVGEPYGLGSTTLLSSPDDYELTDGQLRFHFTASNQMVKSGGYYEINIQADNYNDVNFPLTVTEGEVVISNINIQPALAAGTISTFSLHAANRFDVPVSYLYPELTPLDTDIVTLEQYQYRQATDYGDSNIWKTFGSWNELAVDINGDLSFDVKLPGCIDINDGFDLIAGNASWIYRNISDPCIDVDWAIRYQLLENDNRNVVVDGQHHLYRVTKVDYQLYLTKYDRNGLEMWVKALTSDGRSWFEGIQIYNDQLFITGSTNGDIDGAGSEQNQGGYDLFVQRLDLEGAPVWSRQFGTVDPDYTYGMTINNGLIDILARINTQPDMTGFTVIYQMDTDGNNQQLVLDQYKLGSDRAYIPFQADLNGAYYLDKRADGVKKYNSDGSLGAINLEFIDSGITDMLLEGDALYLSMDATSAYAGETWNINEATAVRVVRLRTSDLSVVWSKLIQSDAPYAGLENSNGQLALYNGVVYLSVVANKELYYAGLVLAETPNYSLNLIALNADGEDDGNGISTGAGYILAHKSWVTGPVHATDDREDPYLENNEMTVSSAGWLHLSINAKQNFVSTAQIGRIQTAPYSYYTNSVIMKTNLEATSIPLSTGQSGITRNEVTGIVTDFDHQLMWDDRLGSADQTGNWVTADAACTALSLEGYEDWRLPRMDQSAGITGGLDEMDRAGYVPVPGSVFHYYYDPADENDWSIFWSGTELDPDYSHVAMRFGSFGDGYANSDFLLGYRCVRDIQ